MVETLRNNRDSMITSEVAKNWTEKSPNSKLKTINSILNDSKILNINEIKNLKNKIKNCEYRSLQKIVWVPYNKCDWKLWNESLNYFKNYINKIYQQYKISVDTQNSLWSLRNEVWDKERFEQKVFSKYPRLQYLNNQLYFDRYSNINNITPFLRNLSSLPGSTLQKIKKYNNRICISDRSVSVWSSNKDLTPPPRGWPESSSRDNVGWVYRRDQQTLYVWRSYINWHYVDRSWTMLHEMGHMFDFKSWYPSQTENFKNFHKLFYNKLQSYFQQGWPWWKAWCSEFFAEACNQFFERWENKFSQYYNKDLSNYMKQILV